MTQGVFIGIDLGTSGVKAVALTEGGEIVAQSSAPLFVSRPSKLWSEQDPEQWWAATEGAVLGLDSALRAACRGIGLAGQMHGATLLDAHDRPLRPAILWNDGRSFAECAELEAAVPDLRAVTGNIAMPGFTAPKLLWVRKNEPELFARTATVLLPKDYVRLRMTGDKASDLSDSAGTLWLDVGRRDWSDTLLDATGLTRKQMPRLFEGTTSTGTLRPDIAACWGLARVAVAAGGGDNAAGAAGVGVIDDGDALLSLGTSGVTFVATRDFRPNPDRAVHAFCHCLPGLWHQMAVHLSAAACVDWAMRMMNIDEPADFFAKAEAAGAGTGPELFLPYLSGERTPHNDPHARGGFLCLDNDSTSERMAAAVLEGVAFALADGIDALREVGTTIEELRVIGGGSRSTVWGQVIAAATGARLIYVSGGEVGPALGAAKLAQLATDGGDPKAVCTAPPVAHIVESDASLAARLVPKRERIRAAYARLRDIKE